MLEVSSELRKERERRNHADAKAFADIAHLLGDVSISQPAPQNTFTSVRHSLETSRAMGNILVNYALFNTEQPAAVMDSGIAWMSPSTPVDTGTVYSGLTPAEMYVTAGSLDKLRQANTDVELQGERETDSPGEHTEAVGVESLEGSDGYGADGGFAGGADVSGGAGDVGGGAGWEE